jgi:signal peptidase II
MTAKRFHLAFALPVFVVLLGLDHWTKQIVSARFYLGEVKKVVPGFFNLTLVHNKGAAFGLGSRWASWSNGFFIVVSLAAVALVIYLYLRLKEEEILSRWGFVLILSGAVGNVVDRIRFGYVVDFLQVYYRSWFWPSFNVADAAITVGAVLFGLEILTAGRRERRRLADGGD